MRKRRTEQKEKGKKNRFSSHGSNAEFFFGISFFFRCLVFPNWLCRFLNGLTGLSLEWALETQSKTRCISDMLNQFAWNWKEPQHGTFQMPAMGSTRKSILAAQGNENVAFLGKSNGETRTQLVFSTNLLEIQKSLKKDAFSIGTPQKKTCFWLE